MKKLTTIILLLLLTTSCYAQNTRAIIYGHISDDGVRGVRIDSSTRAATTIDYEHHEIHGGDHYNISAFQDISSGSHIDIIINTLDTPKWTHMVFEAAVESESSLCIFEGITADNDGTSIPAFNNNRNSSNVSGLIISADSTVTNEGACIVAAKQGSGKGTGGFVRGAQELILKQNTKYLFRISNDSVSTAWASQKLTWYEHTDKL